jgi:glycine cleavage system H protein
MKEIDELDFPDDVRYSKDHEWAKRVDHERIRTGVCDYAQDQLGTIVFVEMPEIGTTLNKGQEVGVLESVKAVSSIYAPMSGEVVAVNHILEDSPELVNQAPYTDGWIVEVQPNAPAEWEELMDRETYVQMLRG